MTSQPLTPPVQAAEHVKRAARELGFDACGIASATATDPDDLLGQWLRRGYHAGMSWLAATQTVRQNVHLKLPNTKSVVVVARNYYSGEPAPGPSDGRVARYAWGRDYHGIVKKPLRRLARQIVKLEPGASWYCAVDSGPVLERTWAERAGLGWVGKNSLILRRDMGSYFVLGVILTTVELAPDAPIPEYCGNCTACLDACPTGAIVAPKVVDANRCISYHTIENRGEFPGELALSFGKWVFGCDVCQEVCPWNRFATQTSEDAFHPRPGQATPDLDELANLNEETFRTRFAGTPVARAKLAGIQRNARIVRENAYRG
ncbi:MAG: tRNA epoxyqueuosine(34) reductase QueG [Candidatus Hydrogenedentes bacterium]|nr:tRNA epoxyqueuosine(34) reductase QueG [Candidatus Hydrogenedentota bacterium]